MAKITITIEDKPNSRVEVIVTPPAESLLNKIASHGPNSLTSAEAYALCAVRTVREESKRNGPTRIMVPRVGRA